MTQPRRALAFAVPFVLAAVAHAQSPSGTLYAVRQVRIERAGGARTARSREAIAAGETIETLKRSRAELVLADGAVLRLDERTRFTPGQSGSGRLESGQIYLRSVTGTALTFALGTLTVDPSSIVTLSAPTAAQAGIAVLKGRATVVRPDGSTPVTIQAGESFVARRLVSGIEWGGAQAIAGAALPTERGGPIVGWWNEVDASRGVLVLPGSAAFAALRNSPLTETLEQLASRPPDPEEIARSGDRNRFLSIVQNQVTPQLDVDQRADPTLSIGAYRNRYGGQTLESRFPVGGSDLVFLQARGIRTVEQLFDAAAAASANLSAVVRHPGTRATYQPGSYEGAPRRRELVLDQTRNSSRLVLAGLVASLLADARHLTFGGMQGQGTLFGFAAQEQALGGRVSGTFTASRTRFRAEINDLELLSDSATRRTNTRISQAVVERDVSPELTLFAGRRRFYSGPVFQNLTRAQLLADRYTALGAALRRGALSAEVAYLYDANPDVDRAQAGALASVSLRSGGGIVGAQAIQVSKLRGGGLGATVSGAFPVRPGALDLYGEVGRGPDQATLATIGAYLPGLYQSRGLDVFVEASHHQGWGTAYSASVERGVARGVNVRAFATLREKPARWNGLQAGLALSFSYGDGS